MDLLSHLQALLNELIADPQTAQLVFVMMFGLAVFALLIAVLLLYLGLSSPVRRRVRQLEAEVAGYSQVPQIGDGARGSIDPQWRRVALSLGKGFLPNDEKERTRISERLRHAGIRTAGALATFYGAKLALALLVPVAGLLLSLALRLPLQTILLSTVSAALAGWLLPTFWLNRRVDRRGARLRRGLPDTLDLLVVCTEAGLGLSSAIQRVAQDLEISQPDLSDELKMFGMQTRAGMDTRSALKDLEERSGVDDIRGLVTSLIQSMRFGTSIASTLRIYASELRDKRTQQAEEKAAKVSTKMLFPLVFCILPSFFVVALGPPLLGAMEAMAGK